MPVSLERTLQQEDMTVISSGSQVLASSDHVDVALNAPLPTWEMRAGKCSSCSDPLNVRDLRRGSMVSC